MQGSLDAAPPAVDRSGRGVGPRTRSLICKLIDPNSAVGDGPTRGGAEEAGPTAAITTMGNTVTIQTVSTTGTRGHTASGDREGGGREGTAPTRPRPRAPPQRRMSTGSPTPHMPPFHSAVWEVTEEVGKPRLLAVASRVYTGRGPPLRSISPTPKSSHDPHATATCMYCCCRCCYDRGMRMGGRGTGGGGGRLTLVFSLLKTRNAPPPSLHRVHFLSGHLPTTRPADHRLFSVPQDPRTRPRACRRRPVAGRHHHWPHRPNTGRA
jgi:hypothetical protein